MFGVDTSELLLIAVVALVFIGPKDLPKAMRTVGRWVGKTRHFNTGIEAMVREAELEEMEKQWRAENERIMREFPSVEEVMKPIGAGDQPGLPLDEPEPPPPSERPLP